MKFDLKMKKIQLKSVFGGFLVFSFFFIGEVVEIQDFACSIN